MRPKHSKSRASRKRRRRTSRASLRILSDISRYEGFSLTQAQALRVDRDDHFKSLFGVTLALSACIVFASIGTPFKTLFYIALWGIPISVLLRYSLRLSYTIDVHKQHIKRHLLIGFYEHTREVCELTDVVAVIVDCNRRRERHQIHHRLFSRLILVYRSGEQITLTGSFEGVSEHLNEIAKGLGQLTHASVHLGRAGSFTQWRFDRHEGRVQLTYHPLGSQEIRWGLIIKVVVICMVIAQIAVVVSFVWGNVG